MAVIETEDVTLSSGSTLTVYGTVQVDYTVANETGCSYDQALAHVGMLRATATEEAIPAYTALVRLRKKKVEDLGLVLSNIAQALAAARTKDDATISNDKPCTLGTLTNGASALATLTSYNLSATDPITYSELQKLQANVQYALDVADNDLQQDLSSLQNFVSKRDSAYELAQKLVTKACQTRSNGIGYIG